MFKRINWFRAMSIATVLFTATAALATESPDPLLDPVAYLIWLLGRIGIPGG